LDAVALQEVALRPVRAHHAFESCVEQLATAVRLGVYPKGSTLPPERELAARMQVSRATLREAIAALRQAGLLETVRGRGGGTVVLAQPEIVREQPADLGDRREELLDSLVFRRVVEPGACEVAATRRLDEDQRALLRAALTDVARAEGRRAHREADSRLHLAIATLTGSPRMIAAVTGVQADLHTLLTAIPVLSVNIDHSTHQHEAIVQAMLAGDPEGARRSMQEHCDDTAALLRGLLG
jgi:GntR family transcriptional repressor for pyruvate dehydrogenase complex